MLYIMENKYKGIELKVGQCWLREGHSHRFNYLIITRIDINGDINTLQYYVGDPKSFFHFFPDNFNKLRENLSMHKAQLTILPLNIEYFLKK